MRILTYELVNAVGTTVKTTTNCTNAKEWRDADSKHTVRVSLRSFNPDYINWKNFHNDRVKKTGKGKIIK